VLAFGQAVDLGRFPGLAEHGLTVKEAADSYALRNHVIDCLERAGTTGDQERRRRMLTFVVVGGGFSGVEVIGELTDLVHRALRYYPHIGRSETRFFLVEYQKAILPEMPHMAEYAARTLQGRGVRLILGHGVKSAAATSLELDDGTVIPTSTIVATIGNGPTRLARSLGVALEKGRLKVEPDLSLPGRDGVWAAGDAALVPLAGGGFAPPTAQAAVRQAALLAANIGARLEGRPTRGFAFRSRGSLASLGGRRAVARIGRVRLSGMLAWVLWRLVYTAMLPAWSSRIRVALDQLLDLFLPRSIVRTRTVEAETGHFVRHRQGDVVMAPGRLGDGVHLVIEGAYEEDGRTYLPGDSFGAEEIAAGRPHQRLVRAARDSRCYVLGREEYARIVDAMEQARRRSLDGGGRFIQAG
jgi:NADH dehydrogenase